MNKKLICSLPHFGYFKRSFLTLYFGSVRSDGYLASFNVFFLCAFLHPSAAAEEIRYQDDSRAGVFYSKVLGSFELTGTTSIHDSKENKSGMVGVNRSYAPGIRHKHAFFIGSDGDVVNMNCSQNEQALKIVGNRNWNNSGMILILKPSRKFNSKCFVTFIPFSSLWTCVCGKSYYFTWLKIGHYMVVLKEINMIMWLLPMRCLMLVAQEKLLSGIHYASIVCTLVIAMNLHSTHDYDYITWYPWYICYVFIHLSLPLAGLCAMCFMFVNFGAAGLLAGWFQQEKLDISLCLSLGILPTLFGTFLCIFHSNQPAYASMINTSASLLLEAKHEKWMFAALEVVRKNSCNTIYELAGQWQTWSLHDSVDVDIPRTAPLVLQDIYHS